VRTWLEQRDRCLAQFFGDDRLTSRWSERARVIEIGGADQRVRPIVRRFDRSESIG
jgi:hypothetical protein